jgi:hypothetical protein
LQEPYYRHYDTIKIGLPVFGGFHMHARLSILIAEERRGELTRQTPRAAPPHRPRAWRTHLGRRLIRLGETIAGCTELRHPGIP